MFEVESGGDEMERSYTPGTLGEVKLFLQDMQNQIRAQSGTILLEFWNILKAFRKESACKKWTTAKKVAVSKLCVLRQKQNQVAEPGLLSEALQMICSKNQLDWLPLQDNLTTAIIVQLKALQKTRDER